ncbi:PERQ amino acid-rich with GYF domain-containing protein 2-like protein, partial [Leptotrombidium deliense]
MAETVMKFGPEWLRALSDGGPNLHNCPTLSAPQKYKLAEYRYGREEMLALFSEKTTLPEELKDSKDILSEKCQIPLALIPMSEEEHRLWSRCVNSDAVLRLAGKTANNVPSERTADRGVLRGKGLAAERGRGRGRIYYQRGSSYEDEAENGSERRDFRGKAFERNASDVEHREKGFDRGLTRNDSIEDGSRRNKDLRSSDNWRSSTRNDDRSWRSRGRNDDGRVRGNSWRSEDHEDSDFRNGFNKKGYNNQHRDRGLSEQWDDCDDDDHRSSLPEWSLDDGLVSEAKVGTFDSSGAFREESIDGDSKDGEEKRWTEKVESKRHCLTEDEKKLDNDKIVLKDEKAVENVPSLTGKPLGVDQNCEVTTTVKQTVLSSNEPSINSESLLVSANIDHNETTIKSSSDDDGFAHLEKAAESMVAQWTAEEDQKERQCKDSGSKLMVVPSHHEDAYKWYYRDPQGELQGPFIPQEMLEWFTAGYFTMDLLVRRGCDEVFSQLGELINTWNRVPFVPGQNPPPIRNVSSPLL